MLRWAMLAFLCFFENIIIIFIIVFIALTDTGLVNALEDLSVSGPEETIVFGTLFNSELSIDGNGFASEYQYMFTGPSESKSKIHGSGNLRKEENQIFQNGVRIERSSDEFISDDNRQIRIHKNEEMIYGPSSFNFGKTLRAMPFELLWEDYDRIHQHTIGLSIVLGIDQAQMIARNQTSEISGTSSNEFYEKNLKRTSKAQLDFNASVLGRARLEIIKRSPTASENGPIDDLITDETYMGPMILSDKLLMETKVRSTSGQDEWLDCCGAGWNSMKLHEKGYFGLSADCIFNCACIQSPPNE